MLIPYAPALTVWFLLMTACDSVVDHKRQPNDSPFGSMSADNRWSHLISAPAIEPIEDIGSNDRLSNFLKASENERLRFRENGLEFWRDFPEDERRFDWLILTVRMAPHYVTSLEDWVLGETAFAGNSSPVDAAKQQRWEREYSSLRSEFWSSNSVDNVMRRHLWMAEIKGQLEFARDAKARGDEIDLDAIISDVLAFLTYFPSFDSTEKDDRQFYADVNAVLHNLIFRPDLTGWTTSQLVDFAHELVATENAQARLLGEIIVEHNGLHPLWIRDLHTSGLGQKISKAQADSDSPIDTWEEWCRIEKDDLFTSALLYSRIDFPPKASARSQDTYMIALWYDQMFENQVVRELGLKYAHCMSDDSLVLWSNFTNIWYEQSYYESLIQASFANVQNRYKTSPIDFRARREADNEVAALLHARTKSSSVLTREYVAQALAWQDLWRAPAEWAQNADKTVSERLLKRISALSDTYASDTAETLAEVVQRDPTVYGLTEAELTVFFLNFVDTLHDSMRRMAAGYFNSVKLEPGVSVSFEVPVLGDDELVASHQFKGKIVLVDHWDTDCAPCIAAFPLLREVYEKYQSIGFEVLSIAYDARSKRSRIERIKNENQLSWKTYDGEGRWGQMAAKFGYAGYPQYMLLDRAGRWVAGTEEIQNGANLEALLVDLLVAEESGFYERQPPIWSFEDKDTTVYLYGTLHSVKAGFDWWSDDAEAALSDAEILYVEILEEPSPEEVKRVRQSQMTSQPGVDLSDYLSAPQEKAVEFAVGRAGLQWADIAGLRPAFAAIELSGARMQRSYGIGPEQSAESHIVEVAHENELELRAFATYSEHVQYMSDLSDDGQVAWLMSSLATEDPEEFDRLFQAWFWGDVQKIETEIISNQRTEIREAYEALIVKRNKEWAKELIRVMAQETGTVFVAVGVGHLVGPDSVQSILATEGYETRRLH